MSEQIISKTIESGEIKEQYLKVILEETGEDKTSMPKQHKVECVGLTRAQMVFAAISALETVIDEFKRQDYTLARFIGALAYNQEKLEKLLEKEKEEGKKDE